MFSFRQEWLRQVVEYLSIFPEVSFLSTCWAFSLEACPKRESLSLSPPSPCLGSGFALDSTPHQALAEHRVSAGGPAAALGAEGSKVCLLVPPWGSGGEPSASSCCSRCRLCPRHRPQPWSQKPFVFFPTGKVGFVQPCGVMHWVRWVVLQTIGFCPLPAQPCAFGCCFRSRPPPVSEQSGCSLSPDCQPVFGPCILFFLFINIISLLPPFTPPLCFSLPKILLSIFAIIWISEWYLKPELKDILPRNSVLVSSSLLRNP